MLGMDRSEARKQDHWIAAQRPTPDLACLVEDVREAGPRRVQSAGQGAGSSTASVEGAGLPDKTHRRSLLGTDSATRRKEKSLKRHNPMLDEIAALPLRGIPCGGRVLRIQTDRETEWLNRPAQHAVPTRDAQTTHRARCRRRAEGRPTQGRSPRIERRPRQHRAHAVEMPLATGGDPSALRSPRVAQRLLSVPLLGRPRRPKPRIAQK